MIGIPSVDHFRAHDSSCEIPGTVTKKEVIKPNWWQIFTPTYPRLFLHLDPIAVEQKLRGRVKNVDELELKVKTSVTILVPKNTYERYAVGQSVLVKFGYSDPINQYFQGFRPIVLLDLRIA